MSGGEIAVLPVGLIIAPVALAAAGAGAAAMLAIRAAQAGTEATGRALERFGDEMERRADAQDDVQIRAQLWDLAAGSVARTNEDLRLLSARAAQAGIRLALPRPVDLTGCQLAGAPGLVAQAQEALAAALAVVERAEAARERQQLLVRMAAGAAEEPDAAELLARHQAVLASRGLQGNGTPPAPTKIDGSRLQADIDAILSRLDGDAMSEDRIQALEAAAKAERKKHSPMGQTFVESFARTVDADLNPRIARRREAANLLTALEQPLVTEVINDLGTPRPPCFDAIERLRGVVLGEADLTSADRRDAQNALNRVQVELDRRRLLEGVAEAFGELGYSVTTGMQVRRHAALLVARPDWRGGHVADVWLDEAGRVHSQLVQVAAGAGGEAVRCAELNDGLRRVGEELDRRGIAARVHVPDEPVRALVDIDPRSAATPPPAQMIEPVLRRIDPTREM
ncbi:hypothetical protein AB0H28_26540 [Micromonospora sp. NPDC050980]|uniref:hypothetical protein n=1 Tax=Micromonospora sp. NPDC050980 TaxID=3155161 RepID=UPI0033DEAF4F